MSAARTAWALLGVVLTLAFARPLLASQGALGLGESAWFLWRTATGDTLLYRVAPEGELGVIAPFTRLPSAPTHLALSGDRLLLLFDTGGTAKRTCSLRVLELPSTPEPALIKAPTASESLELQGQLVAFGASDAGPYALVFSGEAGPERPTAPRLSLRTLIAREWSTLELPPGANVDAPDAWTVVSSDRIELIERGTSAARNPNSARLHTYDADSQTWRASTLVLPEGARHFFRIGGELVAASPLATGDLLLHVLRGERSIELAKWSGLPADRVVVASRGRSTGGAALVAVWREGGATGPFHCRAISPSGVALFDGPAIVPPPIGARDVESVLVLAAAAIMLVGVFALRPGVTKGPEPTMPDGFALAPASSRAFAGLIDLFIGLGLSMAILGVPFSKLPSVLTLGPEAGLFPLALGVLIQVVMSTVGELLSGKTIGKALLGLRTVSYSGGPLSGPQAMGRNMLKLLCPPLALLAVMVSEPTRTVSFRTMVVCKREPEPPPSGEEGP